MARKKHKPFWERAYKGHAYWLGKKKLGKVTRLGGGEYGWEAAGKGGRTDALDKAREAVEEAVAIGDRQLELFG